MFGHIHLFSVTFKQRNIHDESGVLLSHSSGLVPPPLPGFYSVLSLGLLFYVRGCLEGIECAFAYGSLFCVTGVTTCQVTHGFQAVASGTS